MPVEIEYHPPQIEFEDSTGTELTRLNDTPPSLPPPHRIKYRSNRGDPWVDYARILTPDGGILIFYRDLWRGWWVTCLRVLAWFPLMAVEIFIVRHLDITPNHRLIGLVMGAAFNVFLVTRKVKRSHSVAILHDRMVLDGKHAFWAKDIWPSPPQLEPKEGDPDRMVITATVGTRYIELMTAFRTGPNDRTPEVLIGNLQDAMQQLWGRDELDFD